MCITESLFCTTEINTTLQTNYPSIQKGEKLKRRYPGGGGEDRWSHSPPFLPEDPSLEDCPGRPVTPHYRTFVFAYLILDHLRLCSTGLHFHSHYWVLIILIQVNIFEHLLCIKQQSMPFNLFIHLILLTQLLLFCPSSDQDTEAQVRLENISWVSWGEVRDLQWETRQQKPE